MALLQQYFMLTVVNSFSKMLSMKLFGAGTVPFTCLLMPS